MAAPATLPVAARWRIALAKLSDLKALLATAPKRKAASARAEVLRSPRANADNVTEAPAATLEREFADVKPLPPANRARRTRPKPSPQPAQRVADEAAALNASKFGDEPSPATWDIGQELEAHQSFLRSGLGGDVLTKLRRGHWVVQSEIDLHGMTTIEAHDALADFLDDARHQGWRCVRVIHGKGLSSPNREPVLKGKVRRWLTHWDDVLAYCEAQQHAGGSGAVLVLLKARTV
jgi:DNA-nicking Smr family endonuclease